MKKYNNLKGMDPEQLREYKLAQRKEAQKRFYENNKERLKAKYKDRYNYTKLYANRLERLRAMASELNDYPILQAKILNIVDGKDINERESI